VTTPWTILSVAPSFGVGHLPFAGHEETYQFGLADAAAELGIVWRILVPERSVVHDRRAVPCLDPTDLGTLSASVAAHVAQRRPEDGRIGVVMYGGDVERLAAMAEVARNAPEAALLVNLFRAEPGLDLPLVRHRRDVTVRELGPFRQEAIESQLHRIAALRLPPNLRVVAESEPKALTARSAGLPVAGVWPLHSEMAGAGPAGERPRLDGRPTVVLIGLRNSQLRGPVIRQVREVIERTSRFDTGARLTWVLSGRFDTDRATTTALRQLERAGVDVRRAPAPLEADAYARQFMEADVLWMPVTWPYRVQSSGKALDALVLGCPVVAPAGTAGARAMQRWVPGAPAYGTATEAAQVFLRLPTLLDHLHNALASAAEEIRTAYEPRTTVEWAIEVLGAPVPDPAQRPARRQGDAEGSFTDTERIDPMPPKERDARDALASAGSSREQRGPRMIRTRVGVMSRGLGRLRRAAATTSRIARGVPTAFRYFARELAERR